MLAVLAALVVLILLIGGDVAVQPYNSHLSLNAYAVALVFAVYAGFSLYCSMSTRIKYSSAIRYSTTVVGLVLWSIAFVLELMLDATPLAPLHIIPILVEGWIIAQLMSNVRQQDRRAL